MIFVRGKCPYDEERIDAMVLTDRKVFYVPIEGHRHMYRSLMRYFNFDHLEAASLLYPMYVGNIETCAYYGVYIPEVELSRDAFYSLAEPYARPYHTELQMCRSMLSLQRNIQREATIQETRIAARCFDLMIDGLMDRFERVYDCEITDPRTRYDECWGRLTVRKSEPLTIFKCDKLLS